MQDWRAQLHWLRGVCFPRCLGQGRAHWGPCPELLSTGARRAHSPPDHALSSAGAMPLGSSPTLCRTPSWHQEFKCFKEHRQTPLVDFLISFSWISVVKLSPMPNFWHKQAKQEGRGLAAHRILPGLGCGLVQCQPATGPSWLSSCWVPGCPVPGCWG